MKAAEPGLYSTMASLIIEDAPQNGKELFDTIGKHLADAPDSYNRAMKKLFTQVHKDLDAKKLIGAKKEKKVEEKKAGSDDETPSRQAETDASEQGTPGFIKEREPVQEMNSD